MRTTEELMRQDLPKWPQCIITGTAISEDQALEIIRRTDCFFKYTECNNKEHERWLQETLHIPVMPLGGTSEEIDRYFEEDRIWKETWNFVFNQYLDNDYIASTMMQGAQGWCHPDGTIGYFYNIGKWPDTEEVYEELKKIATEWPFLEIECTLMNDEYGEDDSRPIISFLVRNGEVEAVDPEERNLHEEFHRHVSSASEVRDMSMRSFHNIMTKGYESMIPDEIIESWAKFAE